MAELSEWPKCAPVIRFHHDQRGTWFICECPCGSPEFNRAVLGGGKALDARFIVGHPKRKIDVSTDDNRPVPPARSCGHMGLLKGLAECRE